jgi:hypothetical protein
MLEGLAIDEASPWHAGEIALQQTVGVVAEMATLGRQFIRDSMIDQHRRFYEQLPFAVFGAVDPDGLVWASPRAGLPGFLAAKDSKHLRVTTLADAGDPANAGLSTGEAVAMIGIEPATRRRNRLSGRLDAVDSGGFLVAVDESFGNCPQYIQRRSPAYTREPSELSDFAPEALSAFDADARAAIMAADSFYVASFAETPTVVGSMCHIAADARGSCASMRTVPSPYPTSQATSSSTRWATSARPAGQGWSSSTGPRATFCS